ncbi:MAG: hypothetical protein ABF317_07340 [Bacteroidia bacterium]
MPRRAEVHQVAVHHQVEVVRLQGRTRQAEVLLAAVSRQAEVHQAEVHHRVEVVRLQGRTHQAEVLLAAVPRQAEVHQAEVYHRVEARQVAVLPQAEAVIRVADKNKL